MARKPNILYHFCCVHILGRRNIFADLAAILGVQINPRGKGTTNRKWTKKIETITQNFNAAKHTALNK
jgi:hypothetical protein